MNDSTKDMEMVKAACNSLVEHFDTVHIFCTRHESGELDGTVNISYGAGNWFARKGQIHHWLVKEDAEASNGEIE